MLFWIEGAVAATPLVAQPCLPVGLGANLLLPVLRPSVTLRPGKRRRASGSIGRCRNCGRRAAV